jgi:GT2 family glycosyltransferase
MRNNITFCIASAKNEKEYTKLLIKSLTENTKIEDHEILVFIDSDNQNTYEDLLEIKKTLTNLKVHRNTKKFPVGGQRNVSIMFNAAANDIVCYLQSDMVAGKNLDKYILESITENSVVCCTRIEPPVHPDGPEKIVENFGFDTNDFQYGAFQDFVAELQSKDKPNTLGHFAPFAVHKKTWFDKLGGFDTQFRCSREDSDTILRMRLNNIDMIQSWKAYVYHFTCVSSRGKDWFRPQKDKNIEYQNQLQVLADEEELKRYVRKWGFFGHEPQPIYNIGMHIEIDKFVNFQILEFIEVYVKTLYLNSPEITEELKRRIVFNAEYYSNLRWNYSTEYWNNVKYLFNQDDFVDHIQYAKNDENLKNDIIISAKYSEIEENFDKDLSSFIASLNSYVHQKPLGVYPIFPFNVKIKNKIDMSNLYKKVKNTDILLDSDEFVFS